ncbi:MAG: hypothetical protein U0V72_11100 [Cytophagales bacterium]
MSWTKPLFTLFFILFSQFIAFSQADSSVFRGKVTAQKDILIEDLRPDGGVRSRYPIYFKIIESYDSKIQNSSILLELNFSEFSIDQDLKNYINLKSDTVYEVSILLPIYKFNLLSSNFRYGDWINKKDIIQLKNIGAHDK